MASYVFSMAPCSVEASYFVKNMFDHNKKKLTFFSKKPALFSKDKFYCILFLNGLYGYLVDIVSVVQYPAPTFRAVLRASLQTTSKAGMPLLHAWEAFH